MTNKETYRAYCESKNDLSIFHQDWWLDAVCGDQWDVVISRDRGDQIQGCLPYFYQKSYGFTLLRQPILTPYAGIILQYPPNQEKLAKRYAFDKKVTADLIKALPRFSYFNQHFDPAFRNGQPLHWAGFNQMSYVSYALDLTQSHEQLFANFEGDTRTEIRKAETELHTELTEDVEVFYDVNFKSFRYQNINPPYDLEFLKKLDTAIDEHGNRSMYIAKDDNGQVHAGVYLIKDKHTLFTLMIGSDPKFRNRGAVSFLIWNIIKKESEEFESLDFCGSMIERFQNVFRGFGAVQVPYFRVYKYGNPFFKIIAQLSGKGL